MLFFWTFFLSKHNLKNIITVSTKISITRNVASAVNQHIIMISEGSCDTEDYSNDAENSALHHINKLHFTISLSRKILNRKNNHNLQFLLYVYCTVFEDKKKQTFTPTFWTEVRSK